MLVSLFLFLIYFQGTTSVEDATSEALKDPAEVLLMEAVQKAETNPQQALLDAQKVLVMLDTAPDWILEEQAYGFISMLHMQLGNYDQARETIELQLEVTSDMDEYSYSRALNSRAGLAYYLGDYQAALQDFQKSYDLVKDLDLQQHKANTLNNIGLVYRRLGAYDSSLTFYLKAMDFYEALGAEESLAKLMHNIAVIYDINGNSEKAMETLQKVISLKETIGASKYSLAQSYDLFGTALSKAEEYERALEYHQKALEIRTEIDDRSGIATVHHHLGELYFYQEQYEQSQASFQKALPLREALGESEATAITLLRLSDIEIAGGNFRLALTYLNRAVLLIGRDATNREAGEIYSNLAMVHAALENYEGAYRAQVQLQKIRDSLFNSERAGILADAEARYEEQERNKEIDLLKADNLLKGEALAKNRLVRNVGIGIVIVAFSLLFLIYVRFRERRELKSQQAMNERLQRLDKLKDDFLANTSHELRTPLHGIIGIAESLADGATGPLPQKTQDNLHLIVGSGKRLNALVNDLLDFSKMREDRLALQQVPIDLHSLTQIVVALCKPLLGNRNLIIQNDVPDLFPAALGDENRLQQILHNLVGNAIKFTKEGEIVVSAEIQDNMICMSVSDTGIGISPAHHREIFSAFEQIDHHQARNASGSGLGLAITKSLVEKQGGNIWVESELGQGSTFKFTIPKSEKPADEPSDLVTPILPSISIDAQPEEEPISPPLSSAAHIMIVDDDPVNRKVLFNHLHLLGYHLTEANSGQEALDLLQTEPERFNLILLDIMMPGLSGYETCEEIRRILPLTQLPVLFLTAKNRMDDLAAGFAAGCNDFLTKPFNKQELIYRVNTHLMLQDLHRDLDAMVHQRTHDLQERNRDLETLDEVVRNVNRELDAWSQAQVVLDQALKFLPQARQGILYLRDRKTGLFKAAALNGYQSEDFENMSLTLETLLQHQQQASQVKTGVWHTSQAHEPEVLLHPEHIELPKSSLGISLYVGKNLQGYLVLDHPDVEDAFANDEVMRFARFREHASSAVARAVYTQELLETTQELRDAQNRLIEAAHRAGMAEIAIDVLHNIGNSLNHLNTIYLQMYQFMEQNRALKLLQNIVNLLHEKQEQLVHFLTEDERGKTLPVALERITESLLQNQRSMGQEVEDLGHDLERLRDIVTAQNEYANGHQKERIVDLNQVLEDAIAISREQIESNHIDLRLKQEADVDVLASHYQLLSVINHLIRNGIDAILSEQNENKTKALTIFLDQQDGMARIVVEDSGVGMTEDQIVVAFRHGYSTKDGSKGFGLHFCGNAIADLGGQIQITSPGLNKGVRVTVGASIGTFA